MGPISGGENSQLLRKLDSFILRPSRFLRKNLSNFRMSQDYVSTAEDQFFVRQNTFVTCSVDDDGFF
jgi:hypothetical protein